MGRRASMLVLGFALLTGCEARPVSGGRRCGTQQQCEQIHPAGIADPKSADFHGNLIKSANYSFKECQICHGADLKGGNAGVTCFQCHHPDGPQSCTACHDLPPATGAHQAHVAKFGGCDECHVVPKVYTDVGHLFDASGKVIASPTITFGALATQGNLSPTFDGTRCANTYCHKTATPAWNGGASEAACGTCHTIPPADHANKQCATCHPKVVDNTPTIIDDKLHVDGKISLGDDSGTCQACHPVLDGAHDSHLNARHELRAALQCSDCHTVPSMVTSPNHIDQPFVQVFLPAPWSGLAASDGATPSWDAGAGKCNNVYCHGGGNTLGADGAANIVRQPTWVPGSGVAVCGACHGVPPVDAAHPGTITLQQCATCHPTTMNGQGGLISGGTHLDGVIQHAP